MKIAVADRKQALIILAVVGWLLAGALIGRAVTPTEARSAVLTPERWATGKLIRQARSETTRLVADVTHLQGLLAADHPDAVQAMLEAQRIYAAHQDGTSATGPARQALIDAAESVARYASGAEGRDTAVETLNTALNRIDALRESQQPPDPKPKPAIQATPTAEAAPTVSTGLTKQFLPLVVQQVSRKYPINKLPRRYYERAGQ